MTAQIPIQLNINNRDYRLTVEAFRTLLSVLREDLGLTGTKSNCLEGECGACTVLMDGQAVNSCLMLAVHAQGKKIVTIEGLSTDGKLHPVQEAFVENGAVQCGYCTPGFVLATIDLLTEHPNPTDEEINEGLSGNICRCTGYTKIREAVRDVVRKGGLEK